MTPELPQSAVGRHGDLFVGVPADIFVVGARTMTSSWSNHAPDFEQEACREDIISIDTACFNRMGRRSELDGGTPDAEHRTQPSFATLCTLRRVSSDQPTIGKSKSTGK